MSSQARVKEDVLKGAMLWFNEAKGFGFIQTDEGERIRVERDGFVAGQVPVGRCATRRVQLTAIDGESGRLAIDVSFVDEPTGGRARRRSGGRSSSRS